MNEIKIEKNIPKPISRTRASEQRKYLFSKMEVGDSFTTGVKYKTNGDSDVAIRGLSNAARAWKKANHQNWKFSTAKMPDGTIRIWRMK